MAIHELCKYKLYNGTDEVTRTAGSISVQTSFLMNGTNIAEAVEHEIN